MITKEDLQEAIAECIGERNPNANTCIKLAAFYTIKENLYPDEQGTDPPERYSYSPGPSEPVNEVTYQSDTEFSEAIQGMQVDDVLSVVDELMTTISVMMPRLYGSVINRLKG